TGKSRGPRWVHGDRASPGGVQIPAASRRECPFGRCGRWSRVTYSCTAAGQDRGIDAMPTLYALKPAFQGRLRPLVNRLAAIGVTANSITILAALMSIVAGAA